MTYVMNILDIAKNRGNRGKIFHCLVLGPLLRCTNVKLHLTCMVFIPDLSYHYKTIPAQRLFLSVAQCRNFLKNKTNVSISIHRYRTNGGWECKDEITERYWLAR